MVTTDVYVYNPPPSALEREMEYLYEDIAYAY